MYKDCHHQQRKLWDLAWCLSEMGWWCICVLIVFIYVSCINRYSWFMTPLLTQLIDVASTKPNIGQILQTEDLNPANCQMANLQSFKSLNETAYSCAVPSHVIWWIVNLTKYIKFYCFNEKMPCIERTLDIPTKLAQMF